MIKQDDTWKYIAVFIAMLFLIDSIGNEAFRPILIGLFIFSIIYTFYKCFKEYRTVMNKNNQQFLFDAKKDFYILLLHQILFLFGMLAIFIGLTCLSLPWNWIVIDTGIIMMFAAYVIEYYTAGKGEFFSWGE